ncbi:hypothetical protein So717_41140 [Roseobacter cerasinus]|uniref:Uncharacterized protein n=1 Tax=Roseobacter cerasinus TaxID=2602289 RepID=A0A640VZ25_9RHOB|nr:hypothetical protein [Roseobacter cerasinus]GFE52361.1 hypothetical protein So717_41140 [Roseobacter cerasinus]
MRLAPLVLVLPFAACVQFPKIDDATDQAARDAAYPKLIPLDTIPQSSAQDLTDQQEVQESLEQRVSSLQARAARLRSGGLTPEERARLDDKVE